MRKVFFALFAFFFVISCSQKETYKIGVMLPLTGNGAATCINAKNAIELCVEKWNDKGGVLGQQIELFIQDSKNEPKEGINIANRFVQIDHPKLVISAISGIVLNAQPIFESHSIIQLCSVGTENLFATSPHYTIRNFLTTHQTSSMVINTIEKYFERDNFKLFYSNNEFGESVKDELVTLAKNVKIGYQISYDEKENDYRNIISKAELKDDDIIYVAGNSTSLGRLIKQIRESNFNGIIIGSEDVISASALNIIGNYTYNLYYVSLYVSPEVDSLKQEYKKRYKEEMSDLSVLAYNGLDFMLSAISRFGTIDNKILIDSLPSFNYNKYMGNNYYKDNEIVYDFQIKKLEK